MPRKEIRRKEQVSENSEEKRMKSSTPTQAADALIDEEYTGKKKREK